MTRPKVYVPNKGSHDYSIAEDHGEVVFLSVGNFNRYATGRIYRLFEERLRDSSPDDFILVAGLNVMMGIACAIMGAKHGRINLLLFKNTKYLERTVMLHDLNGEEVA